MTFVTSRALHVPPTGAVVATTVNRGGPRGAGPLRRAASVASDLLVAAALVLSIPFVILAIGTPIALCVRLFLWVVGMR